MSQLQLPKSADRNQNIEDGAYIEYASKVFAGVSTSELTAIPAGAVRVALTCSSAFSVSHANSAGFPIAAGGTVDFSIAGLGVHKIYITSTAACTVHILYTMLEVV